MAGLLSYRKCLSDRLDPSSRGGGREDAPAVAGGSRRPVGVRVPHPARPPGGRATREEYDMGCDTGATPAGTLASQAVLDELTTLVHQRLTDSPFWTAFRAGELSVAELRSVFSQYYLWRHACPRGFGVCTVSIFVFNDTATT